MMGRRLPPEWSVMPVPMELSSIIINDMLDQQVISLREVDGERSFSIVIGTTEAMAISRRVKGVLPPRPLTHDLLDSVIDSLGGRLEAIEINNLQAETYFARLHLRRGEELIKVDCRPSDAIALGSRGSVPILVAEHVLEAAAR
jgi:bifunctional DNase/RNase